MQTIDRIMKGAISGETRRKSILSLFEAGILVERERASTHCSNNMEIQQTNLKLGEIETQPSPAYSPFLLDTRNGESKPALNARASAVFVKDLCLAFIRRSMILFNTYPEKGKAILTQFHFTSHQKRVPNVVSNPVSTCYHNNSDSYVCPVLSLQHVEDVIVLASTRPTRDRIQLFDIPRQCSTDVLESMELHLLPLASKNSGGILSKSTVFFVFYTDV